jgi:plasmid stabilization system protein ParE
MRYRLASEARDEYRAAALYYLKDSPRVAAAFVEQVEAGLVLIRERPTTWRVLKADVRRYLVKRFPFGIYYTIEPGEIVVWAIMHLRRKPDYWKTRPSR